MWNYVVSQLFNKTFVEKSIWICKWVSWWCHRLIIFFPAKERLKLRSSPNSPMGPVRQKSCPHFSRINDQWIGDNFFWLACIFLNNGQITILTMLYMVQVRNKISRFKWLISKAHVMACFYYARKQIRTTHTSVHTHHTHLHITHILEDVT